MKAIDPTSNQAERARMSKIAQINRDSLRVGVYYSNLATNEKQRFDRIVGALARKMGLKLNENPFEMIIIRQIALHTVQIERYEHEKLVSNIKDYEAPRQRWLEWCYRERRDCMLALSTLVKVAERAIKVDTFKTLRDTLRDDQGLPKSKKAEVNPDGHGRRYRDDIKRVKK